MTSAPVPAGSFTVWLGTIGPALRGEGESDVPCGTCTGCCTSSQFVLVTPDDTAARSVIPAGLLFPAPFLPGSHLLPYDERGRCPMLGERGCTIYAERPMTCRTYDCRVFPAAGVLPDEPGKEPIATQAARWEFTYASVDAAVLHDAVRAAATFMREHADELGGVHRRNATQLAVAAVETHHLFAHGSPTVEQVRVTLGRRS